MQSSATPNGLAHRGRVVLAVMVLGLSLAACVPLGPVETPTPTVPPCEVASYQEAMSPIMQEWTDAMTLANQTPRIQLSAQVANLQAIRRSASDIVPACPDLEDAHQLALFAMQKGIDGFIAFMAEKPDSTISNLFTSSDDYWGKYAEKVEEINSAQIEP